MYTAAEYIYNELVGSTAITAQIPTANMYAIIAPIETSGDFLTYSLTGDGTATKDRSGDYTVEINVFVDGVLSATQKADVISNHFLENTSLRLRSESMRFTQDLQRAYISLTFTFKSTL